MRKSIFIISQFALIYTLVFIFTPFLYGQITDEDGDWSNMYETLHNTPEADLMVRTGDIDNLGFGWPANFNPFSGNSTPAHSYPWTADTTNPSGTDRIMVITSYTGTPPSGQDGYTSYTSRPENSVRPINLTYSLDGLNVTSAILQIFVDDFQAGLWKASYQVTINNVRAQFMESIINSLMQTGPIGKLISVEIPPDYLYLIEKESLDIVFDDFTTGAGDGYAIDFIKLLVNPSSIAQVGSISGIVYDQNTSQPLQGVRVVANGIVSDTTDDNGSYSLDSVLAGIVNIQTFKNGYGSQTSITELISGGSKLVNFYLLSPAPLVISVEPSDSMYNVGVEANITITFDQDMDTLTFNSANFILSAAESSLDGTFIRSDSILTFVPSVPLVDNAEYRAELTTGIKNRNGISLSDHYVWIFSTGNPSALEQHISAIPEISLLKQNYPNPFNPMTNIEFQIPNSEFVTLKIYDVQGREIIGLINQNLNAGAHHYQFDGTNLASGVYYYQLMAGEYRDVKRMILLR
jgi:hypothetical protein